MLNDNFECSGEVTWRRNDQESTIDYVLITQQLYIEYIRMEADEKQEKFDLSDHNLITVMLKRKDKGTYVVKAERWKEY